MAYISLDQAPSLGATVKITAPRLAWGRITMIGVSLAFWVGLALAIRALF